MNNCQRVLTALQCGQPDRVPVVEFVVDPKVQRAIGPTARDFGEFADFVDLDNVGCGAVFQRVAGDDREWTDEWGVLYRPSPEVVPHPVRGPIASLDDLRAYRPPDPDAPQRLGKLPEFVQRYKGRRAVIFHQRAAFMWSACLMGLDNLLLAFAAAPTLAEAVLDLVVEVNEQIARNAVRAGADIIVLGDDYASNHGPLFSPEHFRRFVLPRLQRVVAAVHEEGGLVIKHSDGNLWALLDMILATGVDGLNPLEPAAGMNLARAKRAYGDRVCLVGNVDCGALLSHGTVAQVEAAVAQCLTDAAAGGGYMLSSSNSIHSSVSPQNYLAMVRAGQRLGRYQEAR